MILGRGGRRRLRDCHRRRRSPWRRSTFSPSLTKIRLVGFKDFTDLIHISSSSGSEHSSQGPAEELQQEDLREARPSHEDNHQSPGQPLQGMCCTNCNCVISLLIKTPQAASGDESILSAECKSMEQYTAGEIIFVLETFLSFPKIEVNMSQSQLV